MQNDNSIRINIRTPSSTNRGEEKKSILSDRKTNFLLSRRNVIPLSFNNMLLYQFLLEGGEGYNISDVLNESLYSDSLEKNPNIKIDYAKQKYKGSDRELCSICQDNFKKNQDIAILHNCDHFFHTPCIEEWGKYKQTCPLCNDEITYKHI